MGESVLVSRWRLRWWVSDAACSLRRHPFTKTHTWDDGMVLPCCPCGRRVVVACVEPHSTPDAWQAMLEETRDIPPSD